MKIVGTLALVTFLLSLMLTTLWYFISGGEVPGGGEISIAVVISLLFTLGCHSLLERRKAKGAKPKPEATLVLIFVLAGALAGCGTVEPPPPPAPPPRPPASANGGGPIETARRFLYVGQREDTAYGLFSYLLLAAEPATETQRLRYRKAIEAYLRTVRAQDSERHLEKREINIFYVPLTQRTREQTDSVLKYYDYARARVILARVPGVQEQGPYVLSSEVPLTNRPPTHYLLQNLALAHPDMVDVWVKEFRIKALEPRFWKEDNRANFVLHLRNVIAVAANVTPAVRDSLSEWIKWIGG